MKVVSYLVRRELNKPTALIVDSDLPTKEENVEVSYSIDQVAERDVLEHSLSICFSSSNVADIIVPSITDALMAELFKQGRLMVFDTQNRSVELA